ncbi:ADP-ribosylation factor-like protein 2-binding protein isoform X1 [Falco biarmicus]|uniref:ADP-ribosylation factor-like protein 2-binding protein isoform X1 n=1 Tax=Falco cherrug TaxID=345164 RepID=UPI00247889DA|nr:ADP-ribosylation factor-like protein 2-binding protein isoform X1 [Falco cherrug]XP_056216322.1 ADP-ribosylation factor-like protein 2-binding protein isoform X1 [Falco biarmicus]
MLNHVLFLSTLSRRNNHKQQQYSRLFLLQPGYAVTMETSDEENFVAISSPSDAEFDTVVGYLEAIIIAATLCNWRWVSSCLATFHFLRLSRADFVACVTHTFAYNSNVAGPVHSRNIEWHQSHCMSLDDDFQLTQRTFMEKHYREFDDSEEYKLIYTFIFNEYISIVKKYMEEKLLDLIPGFDMTAFTMSLQQHKDEMASELFDMLLTFTDFPAFKEMFLDYKAEKEGQSLDLSSGLVVTSLNK